MAKLPLRDPQHVKLQHLRIKVAAIHQVHQCISWWRVARLLVVLLEAVEDVDDPAPRVEQVDDLLDVEAEGRAHPVVLRRARGHGDAVSTRGREQPAGVGARRVQGARRAGGATTRVSRPSPPTDPGTIAGGYQGGRDFAVFKLISRPALMSLVACDAARAAAQTPFTQTRTQ